MEARKGYDLMVIGTEPTTTADGEFTDGVAHLAAGFDGPFAIAAARGPHREDPIGPELRILAPVTGTGFSRRGAEVALHVATAAKKKPTWQRRFGAAWTVTGGGEAATLNDIVRLGEQLGASVRTAARQHAAPEEAILRQAKIGNHNLIIMGVIGLFKNSCGHTAKVQIRPGSRACKVMRAFDEHCAWPDLPRILPRRLKRAGFELFRCEAVPFLTLTYHPNTYVYGLARLIHQFVIKNTGFEVEEADAWLSEFDELEKDGAFFYATNRFLFVAART